MTLSDCCRGTFTIFLVVVNSLLALCSIAVIALAGYGLGVQSSLSSGFAIFLWVMLAAGIVMLMTALMGCCSARSNSKGWLCCYAFLLIIALILTVVYLSFAWSIVYALDGATDCNFSPDSTLGNNCESYSGAMNVTALGYLAQAQACGLQCYGEVTDMTLPIDMTCECTNGDDWFASVASSACPTPLSPSDLQRVAVRVADFEECTAIVSYQENEFDNKDRIKYAAEYFCLCPARFAYAYESVLKATIIPGMIQGAFVLLLVMSSCCLMCIPSQRKVIVSRYYTQQATV